MAWATWDDINWGEVGINAGLGAFFNVLGTGLDDLLKDAFTGVSSYLGAKAGASAGLPFLPASTSVGVDYIIGSNFTGYSCSYGIGTSFVPIEVHGEGSYTWVTYLEGSEAEEAKRKITEGLYKMEGLLSHEDIENIMNDLGIDYADIRECI